MPKEVISKEQAAAAAEAQSGVDQPPDNGGVAVLETPEPEPEKRGPGRPRKINIDELEQKPEPKVVKFRISNVGLVRFKDDTTFPFNKPILDISDPILIEKLTEVASRPKTNIFILEN